VIIEAELNGKFKAASDDGTVIITEVTSSGSKNNDLYVYVFLTKTILRWKKVSLHENVSKYLSRES
jgi:hypothetical protein